MPVGSANVSNLSTMPLETHSTHPSFSRVLPWILGSSQTLRRSSLSGTSLSDDRAERAWREGVCASLGSSALTLRDQWPERRPRGRDDATDPAAGCCWGTAELASTMARARRREQSGSPWEEWGSRGATLRPQMPT